MNETSDMIENLLSGRDAYDPSDDLTVYHSCRGVEWNDQEDGPCEACELEKAQYEPEPGPADVVPEDVPEAYKDERATLRPLSNVNKVYHTIEPKHRNEGAYWVDWVIFRNPEPPYYYQVHTYRLYSSGHMHLATVKRLPRKGWYRVSDDESHVTIDYDTLEEAMRDTEKVYEYQLRV